MPATTTDYEIWTKNGRSFYLVPITGAERDRRDRELLDSLTDEEAAMWEPWYPDFPGEREPVVYELVAVDTGEATDSFVSRPYDPCNWYDAVVPLLYGAGYEGPPPTEEDLAACEHGLSLRLCAGPNHYPDEF